MKKFNEWLKERDHNLSEGLLGSIMGYHHEKHANPDDIRFIKVMVKHKEDPDRLKKIVSMLSHLYGTEEYQYIIKYLIDNLEPEEFFQVKKQLDSSKKSWGKSSRVSLGMY